VKACGLTLVLMITLARKSKEGTKRKMQINLSNKMINNSNAIKLALVIFGNSRTKAKILKRKKEN